VNERALNQKKARSMRILSLCSVYPRPGYETLGLFHAQLHRALAKCHDVRVIAPVPWPQKLRGLLELRPRLRGYRNRDGIWVTHPAYFYIPKLLQHRFGDFYLASIRRAVERVASDFRPDVLFGCWAHPDGWAAVRLARDFGVPVVIRVIGSDVLVATRNPRRRSVIAQTLQEADGVVAVCRDLAEHVTGLGVNPDKVQVIPEGLDTELFCPGDQRAARSRLGLAPRGSMLLFVGNLLFSKGAGVFVESCARLRQQDKSFQAYLLGQGRDQARVRALIHQHRLCGRVQLTGARPHGELPDWYRACDLVVLPTFSEGIPNVLREALACGKRFVATAVGGIPDIADASFSRLVAPGDVEELTRAIVGMLASPGAVDRDIVREFSISWEQSAELYAERLQALVKRRREESLAGRRRSLSQSGVRVPSPAFPAPASLRLGERQA
jgi:teichuronic acid biosynthesis glycosyltransferase TuaC